MSNNAKISLSIDVSKVDKTRFEERRYFNKENKEIVIKEMKLDVVPLREPKLIKDGGQWSMWKTHFVALPQTKEEKASKAKSIILGDGITFKTKEPVVNDGVDESSIPF